MSDELRDFRNPVKMVDVSQKPVGARMAEAMGEIRLKPETVEAIRHGHVEKGDVLAVAEVAGILAAKRTADIIPLCHTIPLTQINIHLDVAKEGVTARCIVSAGYKTGVEMEALVGVTTCLLTIWDMVKYLEKDEEGQYPRTRIRNIQVTKKQKEV